jgi:hypothetical protein
MKLISFLLVATSLMTACGKKYYNQGNDNLLNNPDYTKYTLTLDDSFETYVRTIHKNVINNQVNLYLNESLPVTGKNLVEVSYLLISKKKEVAIYVTCMPDKYENYYDSNWAGPNAINTYDVKVIDLGKVKGSASQAVEFNSKPKADPYRITWNLIYRPNEIEITSVLEEDIARGKQKTYSVATELSKPMIFKKTRASFIFNSTGKAAGGTVVVPGTAHLKTPELNILRSAGKHPYIIYFKMDQVVGSNNSGATFDGIFFKDDRTYYDPVLAIGSSK